MNTQTRKYLFLIVHHGDPLPTYATVAAARAGTRQPDRIIVIDNADTPLDRIDNLHASVEVLRPENNSGYAGGLNIGLGALFVDQPQADDVVVFLNNDVQLQATTLERLAAWIHQHPQPALWGYQAGVVNFFSGRATLVNDTKPQRPWSSPYIHGAFFAMPWQVAMQLRGLPDRYFLYWEDVLMSSLVHRAGYPLVVIPHLAVTHPEKRTPATGLQLYYLVRNGAHYLQTYLPWGARSWWRIYNSLRYAYHRLIGSRPVADAIGDARRGRLHQRGK